MIRTGPTSIQTRKLIIELKKLAVKQKVNIWKKVAEDLSRPTRNRSEVSIAKIDRNARKGETILVPGKVLSSGDLSQKITVAALMFSAKAKEKINASGNAITIQELIKSNPKGQKVRILA